jgi:P-type conjugative transfer protein TrbL
MTASVLDEIVRAFATALETGAQTLGQYSLGLLGIFALFAGVYRFAPLLAAGGGAMLGDVLASLLFFVLGIGIYEFILLNLTAITNALFAAFVQWGTAAASGTFDAERFFQPSTIVDLGFRLGWSLLEMGTRLSLWARATAPMMAIFGYSLAYWIILASFAAVAIHLMVVLIEFKMGVMLGAVLIPWTVFQPVAFFGEFAIGWLTGTLIRVLIIGSIVGIATPLFHTVTPALTPGGDPTQYSSTVMALTSVVFAILAWVIPGRAARMAGRGISLALDGSTIMAGAAGAGRFVLFASHAVRGTSQLLRR